MEINQFILPFQSSQAYKTSYWEISSLQWDKRDPLLPPLCSDQWVTFFFRDPWRQVGLGLLGLEFVDVSMERTHAILPSLSNEPSSGAFRHLEPRSPPAGHIEGRIVEGECLRPVAFLTGHSLGEGADDEFISLNFLCTGPDAQAG